MEEESPEELGYHTLSANLAESSVRDRNFKDLDLQLHDLVLFYGDHRGHPQLRQLLADEAGLTPADVLLSSGAAMALFLVHMTLLGPGDHLIVARPNYATNLETPYAIGCEVSFLDLRYEEGWNVDPKRIAAMLRPQTRLISLTTPHNPTGTEMDRARLDAVIHLCEQHGCHLLLDQTYRELSASPLPVAAGLSDRVISVSSISKTYGLPGLRVGWLLSADSTFLKTCLAAKEQVVLTGSVLDEAVAFQVLSRRAQDLPVILATLAQQRLLVENWLATQPRLSWVRPGGGVTGFLRMDPAVDSTRFYQGLRQAGVMVGPGHWFGQPAQFFRLGWGWPLPAELALGLKVISDQLTG